MKFDLQNVVFKIIKEKTIAIVAKITKRSEFCSMRGGLTYCEAEFNDYECEREKFVRI